MRKLIEDPKLLESLRKQMSPEDVARLKKNIQDGKKLGNDLGLKKLLEEGKLGKVLKPEEEALLKRWDEKLKDQGEKPPVQENPDNPAPDKQACAARAKPSAA